VILDYVTISVGNELHRGGLGLDAIIGQHRKRRGHVQGAHHRGTQGQRQVGLKVIGDTHPVGIIHHQVGSQLFGHAHRADVARQSDRGGNSDCPHESPVTVLGAVGGKSVAHAVGNRRIKNNIIR